MSNQYNDILRKIEQDVKDHSGTDLYRYKGLLEAIRFFSNRLTLQQITDAAFDFVNEMLTVEKSALYIIEDDKFVLTKSRGIKHFDSYIDITPELSEYFLFVGNVLWGRKSLDNYFDSSLLDSLNASVMLPLAIENKLYGFFILSQKIAAPFNENDILVCETLMNLFNNSLQSTSRFEQLQASNHELDEKIFNLFAINQSAKAMLTEHQLDPLFDLAVDVFSELTQSANTGFVLYDNASERYVLKAYRDVFASSASKSINISLEYNGKSLTNKYILDLSLDIDRELFESIFKGSDTLANDLRAKYIVFIIGDNQQILGFVSLGKTVTGYDYKKSAFELVDSLASYTYIALSNALHIEQVNKQKKLLQNKLDRMITLNRLSKNINSALDSKSLIELTLKTLTVSFDVEKALIALYDEDSHCFHTSMSTDLLQEGSRIEITPAMQPLRRGSMVFEAESDKLSNVIGEDFASKVPENSGVLIIPISMEQYETILVGAIFIFGVKQGAISNEENTLIFDTIANHLAPLLEGFKTLEKQKKLLKKDMAKVFISHIETQINEAKSYDLDLEIIRINDPNATAYTESQVPAILHGIVESEYIYPVSYEQTEILVKYNFEETHKKVSEALNDKGLSLTRYCYKKDFTDFESFIQL